MFRGLKKLINLRKFTSSKDTLKDQFKKMTDLHSQAPKQSGPDSEDIKLKDQEKTTEALKSKFDEFKSDLSKNTGEAKSMFEKLYETAKTFKKEDLSFFNKSQDSPKNDIDLSSLLPKEELLKDNLFEDRIAQPPPEKPKSAEPSAEPSAGPSAKPSPSYSESFSKKFPKTSYYTSKCSSFIGGIWRETFPKEQDKIERLVKIHEIRKLSQQLDEKLLRGEITEDDLPAWKKSALAVMPKKTSTWEKLKSINPLKEKLANTQLSEATSNFLQSDSVKQMKSQIKDFKAEISEIKEMLNEAIEDRGGKAYDLTKSAVRESFLETPEAKAVKIMRLHDPEFDIYGMQNELPIHCTSLFNSALCGDKEFVHGITTGQAKDYFAKYFSENYKGSDIGGEVLSISRCTYLGSKFEDKDTPVLSYSMKISWCTNNESVMYADSEIEPSKKGEVLTMVGSADIQVFNFFVAIAPHEDPDVLKYRHPWKFLVFFQANESGRVT